MSSPTQPLSALIGMGAVLLWLAACSKPNGSAKDALPSSSANSEGSASGAAVSSGVSGSSSDQGHQYGPCGKGAGTTGTAAAGGAFFEPAAVPNNAVGGVAKTLTLYASTLRNGPNGLELYAGVCNAGEFPMCSAALQVEFYDHADQLIGTVSSSVQSGRLYRFSQSPYPIFCVPPGHTAMASITSLPEGLALDDLKYMDHRFPAFQLDEAVTAPGARVSMVEPFEVASGTAFRGTVTNDSDSPVTNPVVSVFPVNEVGRPLGVGTSTAAVEIPPGGTWSFSTSSVAERGVDQLAFAAASFPAAP